MTAHRIQMELKSYSTPGWEVNIPAALREVGGQLMLNNSCENGVSQEQSKAVVTCRATSFQYMKRENEQWLIVRENPGKISDKNRHFLYRGINVNVNENPPKMWAFNHYLLDHMVMESQAEFCSSSLTLLDAKISTIAARACRECKWCLLKSLWDLRASADLDYATWAEFCWLFLTF